MNDKERIDETKTVHLYIAIRRTKENRDSGLKELCFRHVIRDETKDLEYIKQRIYGVPGVWRIYKTVNARDVEMARKLLITKLTMEPEAWRYRVDSLWKTTLLQPKCKAERNLLLDVDNKNMDTEDKLVDIFWDNHLGFSVVKTPNGIHFVVEKCDTRLFDGLEDLEIKRDGYVFVERIDNGK